MPVLEKLVEELDPDAVADTFRLWLSAMRGAQMTPTMARSKVAGFPDGFQRTSLKAEFAHVSLPGVRPEALAAFPGERAAERHEDDCGAAQGAEVQPAPSLPVLRGLGLGPFPEVDPGCL